MVYYTADPGASMRSRGTYLARFMRSRKPEYYIRKFIEYRYNIHNEKMGHINFSRGCTVRSSDSHMFHFW